MTKVTVGICAGTSCHLLGGMDLFTVLEEIKLDAGDDLVIKRYTCLNNCQKGPNVVLNGQLYTGMTPEQLKEEVARQMRQEEESDGFTG